MDKTIIDNNKLIDNFVVSLCKPDSDGCPIFEGPNGKIRWTKEVQNNSYGLSKYHESWDWLMPVVEKIEKLMSNWDISNRSKYGYNAWMDKFKFAFWDIKYLYNHIIEFIKWYNSN